MSYADAWLKWFDTIERGAAPLSRRMIELAAIGEDDQILDIGTGNGEPALTVARLLGPNGRVRAIDCDPEMIALARERARGATITSVEFEVAEIESLRPDAASLDCILARWSLMFVEDLPRVLANLRRSLRRGGRLVIATWAQAEQVPSLTLARRVARETLGLEPPEFGHGTPFGLADAAATERLLAEAGFIVTGHETVAVTYRYDSVESYLQNRLDLTGPLWEGMDTASQADRDAVFAAIEGAMQDYLDDAGVYVMTNTAICIGASAG